MFAHGHILRVLAARWIDLPASYGEHFLLDTATLNVLGYYYAEDLERADRRLITVEGSAIGAAFNRSSAYPKSQIS